MSNLANRRLKKIPIIISKYCDGGNITGWSAQLADTYENYKTANYEDLNFEDLSFHFGIVCAVDMLDYFFFYTRRDAVKCAKHINEKYLNNKAKIWFVN